MRRWETWSIRVWSWGMLIVAGTSFALIIPSLLDVQTWIFEGWDMISFPIWFLAGIVLGIASSQIMDRWPKASATLIKRASLVLFGYIGIAIIVALFTGEGEGVSRIGNSGPVKVWGMFVWALLSLSPSLFGSLGILTRRKWARGASVLSFITLGSSAMIYSQAGSAEVLSQDPALSIVFIAALIGYVEGVNWLKRFVDDEDGAPSVLFRRQASFTILFLGISSGLAFLPFVLSDIIITTYEGNVILGKAIVGALLLVPLGLFAAGKNILDGRKDM